jgi:hypothetical protein
MPLPPSVPRDELHLRRIELHGYRRHDGLYAIEARIVDTKTSELKPLDGTLLPARGDVARHVRSDGRGRGAHRYGRAAGW